MKAAGESFCAVFLKEELNEDIFQMRIKDTPGTGDIPPKFFKAPGPKSRQDLVDIFNYIFIRGTRPISGRPPSSCLSRKRENNQDVYPQTDWGLALHFAGFRKNRSYEDQIGRLTQSIGGG